MKNDKPKTQDIVVKEETDTTSSSGEDIIPPVKHEKSSRWVKGQSGNPDKVWKPGQSGNPAGRTPKVGCVSSHIRDILAETEPKSGKTYARLLAENMIQKSISKDTTKGTASIVKEVLDRIEGKVKEELSLDSDSLIQLIFSPARRDDTT